MSLLKSKPASSTADSTCNECSPGADASVFRLIIEPSNTDVRDQPVHDSIKQLSNAERLQNLFAPSLLRTRAHVHENGYHVHPEQPASVGHIEQMHTMMEPHGLVARLSLAPGNDEAAVTAALTSDHVQELVKNGIVDVKVPLDQGTFRLHSTRTGRITGVEFSRT